MRLETLRIVNCFGFADSGLVEISDNKNLIYVLGRNSSGKSSFLNAIKSFGKGIVPNKIPKFENFDKARDTDPHLEASFTFRTKLSRQQFESDFRKFLKGQGLDEPAFTAHPPNADFFNETVSIYANLIEKLNARKGCVVVKYFDGNYKFLIEANDNSYQERFQTLNDLRKRTVNTQGHFHTGSAWAPLTINQWSGENVLFNQFPKVALFNEQFGLSDDLPNTIGRDWKENSNELTKSFVHYLGEDLIEELLFATVPEKIRNLEEKLNEKAGRLVSKINAGMGRKPKHKLLGITILFMHEGLQITLFTDDKPSYYSQLSDIRNSFLHTIFTRPLRELKETSFFSMNQVTGFIRRLRNSCSIFYRVWPEAATRLSFQRTQST